MRSQQKIWQDIGSRFSGSKRAASLLSVSCLLLLLAIRPVIAQDTPPPTVNPPVNTVPETVKPAAPVETNTLTEADVALYKKAITSVQKSRGIQLESEVTMLVEGQGLKVSIKENLKITGKSPNKYRADLAILPPAQSKPTRFTIVSNGSKVFTHRPGMKQYAVRPASGRGGSEMNPFETGLFFGFLVIGTGQEEMSNVDALRKGGGTISVATDTLDGKEYRVFAIAPPDNSFKMRFYVEPTSARIDQVEMRGKDNGQEILMTERVAKQSLTVPLTASTFVFIPPKGTKKVPAIDVSDF